MAGSIELYLDVAFRVPQGDRVVGERKALLIRVFLFDCSLKEIFV